MKKLYIPAIFLLAICNLSLGQCDEEKFLDNCYEKIDGYTYLEAFKFDKLVKEKREGERSYIFLKNTTYVIAICDLESDKGNVVVDLYDRNRKKVASSYNRGKRKYYDKISYRSLATGVYYLKFRHTSEEGGCGIGMLSFSKSQRTDKSE